MVASQRKYICSFCAKAFSRSEHKARHERSHTGCKPFSCALCSHSFVRRDLLQRHIRTVHKATLHTMMQETNKTMEEVINSLIRVNPNNGPLDGKLQVVGNESTGRVGKNSVKSNSQRQQQTQQALLKHDGVQTLLPPAVQAAAPVQSATATASLPLPMTPSDDEMEYAETEKRLEVMNDNDHDHQHCNGRCHAVPDPISLDKEVLKTIFAGRFGNVLDSPDIVLNNAFEFLHTNCLFSQTLLDRWNTATRDESSFDQWCKNSSLPLALLSVNLLLLPEVDPKRKSFLLIWQTCWQQCMRSSYDESFLPLSILIYVHIHSKENLSHSVLTTSIMYQQIIFAMIKSDEENQTNTGSFPIRKNEIWSIFDIFVCLLLKSEEFTEVSTLIYQWFLCQKLYHQLTLAEILDRLVEHDMAQTMDVPVSTVLTVSQALFCETVMFKGFDTHYKSKHSLHNAVILINRLASKFLRDPNPNTGKTEASKNRKLAVPATDSFHSWKVQVFILHAPPKFVDMINSYCVNPTKPQYWHLYVATWFEFVHDVVPSSSLESGINNDWTKFHLSSRWFHTQLNFEHSNGVLHALKSAHLVNSNINNNLAICCLPVISNLQQNWTLVDPAVKKLAFNTLLFQVKIFATTLLLENDESERSVKDSMEVFSNPIIHLLLFVWYCFIYHRSDGMPKLLYRREIETNLDNYTMENHSVSQFIKKYIVLSRKCIDTDALIENDFKKLLFRDEVKSADDFTNFKGYHFLLSRILDTIVSYLQVIVLPSDPESELSIKLVGELKQTISKIQMKINHPSAKSPNINGYNMSEDLITGPESPISSTHSSVVSFMGNEEAPITHSMALQMSPSHDMYSIHKQQQQLAMQTKFPVQLPPLKLGLGTTNFEQKSSRVSISTISPHFETTSGQQFSGPAGNSRIVLPRPMFQSGSAKRDNERFTLPPPSTFFSTK